MSDEAETPKDRRQRFLRSAADAEARAQTAPSGLHRDLCLYIAKYWRQMASEIEGVDA